MKESDWQGCYDLSWKGIIVDEAMSHPAKFAHGLIRRIYQHLRESYGVQADDTILDPFGGVGLGALYALKAGLNWYGVELEQRFVDLGQQNIDRWNREYGPHFQPWGNATLLQGDSRRLVEVIGRAGAVVGSPPYATGDTASAQSITRRTDNSAKWIQQNCGSAANQGYGSTPGQLASMSPGDLDAIVASPPFAGNSGGRGEASRNGIDAALFDRHSGGMIGGTGDDPHNLAHLRMGMVGSPPFENSLDRGTVDAAARRQLARINGISNAKYISPIDMEKIGRRDQEYGSTSGQLGNDSGETFWAAAAVILQQCALILPPAAPAVWVLKAYVKGGKLVNFPGQWQQLCESCGFETVEVVRAWQVKNQHEVQTLDGETIRRQTRRASFFRILAEKNGAPVIDHEIVLFTRRRIDE
jgi:hypothetical protein